MLKPLTSPWQWPFAIKPARQWQAEQASRLNLSAMETLPNKIGGADIGLLGGGRQVRAAICVFEFPSLKPLCASIAIVENLMPYIPGLLAFREVPALCQAWQQLPEHPELLLVDGQGIAHPQRFGNASHLGALLDIATIGVAKSRLTGSHAPLPDDAGSVASLFDDRHEPLGWVLRSKARCNPLYLSPGHRVSVDDSLQLVQACLRGYRLPEPTRWADALASIRPNSAKLLTKFPVIIQ